MCFSSKFTLKLRYFNRKRPQNKTAKDQILLRQWFVFTMNDGVDQLTDAMVVVQHWSHSVKPEAIKVILLHPPAQVGEEEPHHFPAMGNRERHFLQSFHIKSTLVWWNKNPKINHLEHTLVHINTKKKHVKLFTMDTFYL